MKHFFKDQDFSNVRDKAVSLAMLETLVLLQNVSIGKCKMVCPKKKQGVADSRKYTIIQYSKFMYIISFWKFS